MLVEQLTLWQRLLVLWAWALAGSAWVYATSKAVKPGPGRLLLCFPVVVLDFFAPLLISLRDEALLVLPTSAIFSLSAFKVSNLGKS